VSWLTVTFELYRRTFTRAAVLTLRNWPVFAAVLVYGFVLNVTFAAAPLLGIVGGFLASLVWAGCVGSFLYLVEMMVRTSRVTLDDFRRSAGAYLWDVVGVTFIVWVAFWLLRPALATVPQGAMLLLGLNLVAAVFFNAVPELIYLGRCSSLDLLRESYGFIGDNWIEWFPATFALATLILVTAALPVPPLLDWLKLALVALLLVYAMVVRGLLFLELQGTSRRSRAFRYRMGE